MDCRAGLPESTHVGKRVRIAATVLAAAAVIGCQTFRPAEPAGLRPGQTVRVDLADSAARARAGWSGPDRGRLTGEVVRSSGQGMELSIRSRPGGSSLSPYRDTLSVPASIIRSVEKQRISALRSAAVAGGVVAATALVFELSATGGGLAPPGNDGGGAESIGIRIPLIP